MCSLLSTQVSLVWNGSVRGLYDALSSSQHAMSLKTYKSCDSEYNIGQILRARPLLTQLTDGHKTILHCVLDNYDSRHFVRSNMPQNYEKYQIIQATEIKIKHGIKWENKHSVAI